MDTQVIQNLEWWEVGAGILSIPIGLLGLIYTYVLIRKTSLEAQKLRLEIVEKEGVLPVPLRTKQSGMEGRLEPNFELSRKRKLLFGLSFALNLAIILLFGLKTSPLMGLEVLIIVNSVVNCFLIFILLAFLWLRGLIFSLLRVDKGVVEVLELLVDAVRGGKSATKE